MTYINGFIFNVKAHKFIEYTSIVYLKNCLINWLHINVQQNLELQHELSDKVRQ